MKIVFYEVSPEDQTSLHFLITQNPSLRNAEVVFEEQKLNTNNILLAKEASIVGVFINSEVRKEQFEQMPNLQLIVTMSTGYDHIDLEYAKARGVTVCNVPNYGSRTVAEFTFALILGLSRKAFVAFQQVKDKHDFSIAGFEGFNLQGKTLGIVGTGRIGQNVAKIAQGFEMRVIAYDTFPNQEAAANLNFTYVQLNDLLSQSDVVSLHVPYNKDTYHLINTENIGYFKKGSLLINTSRGEVVEVGALMRGLQEGILSGVGLDVIEGERMLIDEWHVAYGQTGDQERLKTLLQDHALMDSPRVALMPHIAFFTMEAKHEILTKTMENIMNYLQNNPQNVIV